LNNPDESVRLRATSSTVRFVFLINICAMLAFQPLLAANCNVVMTRQLGPVAAVVCQAPLNTAQPSPASQHTSSHCNCSDLSVSAAPHSLDGLAVSTSFVVIRPLTPHVSASRL